MRPLGGMCDGCRGLSAHCITSVPVASVIAAIASLLDEKTSSGWSADAS